MVNRKADKSGNSAAEDILSNPDYASLKAVQDQKVYGTPNAPFSWVDIVRQDQIV